MKPNILLLETELKFKVSRSGGPGGQNVNKVATKVQLDFDVRNSRFLVEQQKQAIELKLASRITNEGILQIVAQTERSQLRNKQVVRDRFYHLIEGCFQIPKGRKPTKISKGVKERRLKAKKQRGDIKKQRNLPLD